MRKDREKFEVEVGHGVNYRLHSAPRPAVPGYGDVVAGIGLPDREGVVTVYSSGYIVIETEKFSLEFNVNTGSMKTL